MLICQGLTANNKLILYFTWSRQTLLETFEKHGYFLRLIFSRTALQDRFVKRLWTSLYLVTCVDLPLKLTVDLRFLSMFCKITSTSTLFFFILFLSSGKFYIRLGQLYDMLLLVW